MSERSFFREINIFPGLIFIIVVVLLNGKEIFQYLLKDDGIFDNIDSISAIIGFSSTFFGGAVISFMVSQIWYLIWTIFFEVLYCNCSRFPFNIINKQYGYGNDKRSLLIKYQHMSSNLDGEFRNYIDRRQDLFNLLGSVIVSIIGGLLTGWRLKYLEWSNYEKIVIIFLIVITISSYVGLIKVVIQMFNMTMYANKIPMEKIAKHRGSFKENAPLYFLLLILFSIFSVIAFIVFFILFPNAT